MENSELQSLYSEPFVNESIHNLLLNTGEDCVGLKNQSLTSVFEKDLARQLPMTKVMGLLLSDDSESNRDID